MKPSNVALVYSLSHIMAVATATAAAPKKTAPATSGKQTNSFALLAKVANTSERIFLGQPVPLMLTMKNVSTNTLAIWKIRPFDAEYKLVVKGAQSEGGSTIDRNTPPADMFEGSLILWESQPGSEWTNEIDLAGLYDFQKPGIYTVFAVRAPTGPASSPVSELTSETVRFELVRPEASIRKTADFGHASQGIRAGLNLLIPEKSRHPAKWIEALIVLTNAADSILFAKFRGFNVSCSNRGSERIFLDANEPLTETIQGADAKVDQTHILVWPKGQRKFKIRFTDFHGFAKAGDYTITARFIVEGVEDLISNSATFHLN